MRHFKLWISLVGISVAILIGALVSGLVIANKIQNKTETLGHLTYEQVDYHLMMILNAGDQNYSEAFERGVQEASQQRNIVVETVWIDQQDYLESVLDRLDMAIFAKVDGIILHAYDDSEIVDRINRASEMGIPVITLHENVHQSKRLAYVGNSQYSVGIDVGKTIARLTDEQAKVAVIDQSVYDLAESEMDLLSLGISDVFENYDYMDLVTTRRSTQGVLSAENVALSILDDYPNISVIFSTNGQATLGIVQVLIDQNKVNDVTVIGSSDNEEILRYIQQGNVIEATLVTDCYSIGKGAIETFYNYMTEGLVNTQISPSITVVDKSNIKGYLEARDEINQ